MTKRISDYCKPTFFSCVRKFCKVHHDFVVAKISGPKPVLYLFKFINIIGLVKKLIILNKLITGMYLTKPSHCELKLV